MDAIHEQLDIIDGEMVAQFARLNQIYRERRRQLAAGIDVLKEEEPKK